MNSKKEIESFFTGKKFALAGLSRSGQAMSNSAKKELEAKGYTIYGVNPEADSIDGSPCYPSLSALPGKPDGVIIFTRKDKTLEVLKEASRLGIKKVWIQQGAHSPEAETFCRDKGMEGASGKCVLMFAEPVTSMHRFHKSLVKLFGKLPR